MPGVGPAATAPDGAPLPRGRTRLWQRIVIGLVLGVAVGHLWGAGATHLQWIGDLFIRLIRMLVSPLIFVTISAGIVALGDPRTAGRLGGRTLLFYACNLAVAVAIGLALAVVLEPGKGIAFGTTAPSDLALARSPAEMLLGIVPLNPVKALAEGDTLAIIFFAALFGIGVLLAGERGRPVADLLGAATDVFLRLVGLIMEVAPIGVFALIAVVVGTAGPQTFLHVFKLALCVAIGASLQTLVFHGGAVRLLGWLPILPFFRGSADAIMVGLSTASSSAALPVAMRVGEENLGLDKAIAATVLPLGTTIGMDGTGMYMAMLAVFAAQAFGVPLGVLDLALLLAATTVLAMGAAPVPSGSLFVLPALTGLVGIDPVQTALVVGFILPFDRPLDMMRTVPNVTSDLLVATVLSRWAKRLDLSVYLAAPRA